jgi:hypothetical protein
MPKLSAYSLDPWISDEAFNATFQVYRNTVSMDDSSSGSGGITNSWSVVDSGAGRARELIDHERLANDVRKDKLTHKLYCSPLLDVQRNDVIVVTNAPAGSSSTFLVMHPHLPDNVLHHFEIKAKSFIVGSSETPAGFDILAEESD